MKQLDEDVLWKIDHEGFDYWFIDYASEEQLKTLELDDHFRHKYHMARLEILNQLEKLYDKEYEEEVEN